MPSVPQVLTVAASNLESKFTSSARSTTNGRFGNHGVD